MEQKLCVRCQTIKEGYLFPQRSGKACGRICNACKEVQRKNKKPLMIDADEDDKYFGWVVTGARQVLKNLNYDTDKNIHEQFKQRWKDRGVNL